MDLSQIAFHYDRGLHCPKYLQLADALESWLKGMNLTEEEKFPSDRQLGEYFGMGTITVTRSVNELVRRRLLLRRVGAGTYTVSAGTSAGRVKCRIAVVHHVPMPSENDPWSSPIISYWQNQGNDLIFLVSGPEGYEKAFYDYDLAGMIVLSPRPEFYQDIIRLTQSHFPIVAIGIQDREHPELFMGTDHREFARRATEYLTELGHRRIGFISRSYASGVQERCDGYMEEMFRQQLPVNPRWILFSREEKYAEPREDFEAIRKFFDSEGRPTAVLVPGHRDIQAVYGAVRAAGLRIPEDVSVMAFDDPDYASVLTPPLTVLSQPLGELCRHASRQLENMIAGRELERFPDLNPVLIIRGSCAAPPQE